jgi:hypothetical protein
MRDNNLSFHLALVAGSLLLLLSFLLPSAAYGQTSVRLLPQVGAWSPTSEMETLRDDGEGIVGASRQSSSLAWGLGLEVGPAREGTSFRVNVGYGTDRDVPVWGTDCPGCSARSSLLTGTAAAVFRPIPRLVIVQPHFLVGAGFKQYGFEFQGLDDDASTWEQVFRDQTRAAGQAGVGAEVSILGLRTQWELNGYVSRFRRGEDPNSPGGGDTSLQTDLFLTLAIPLGG